MILLVTGLVAVIVVVLIAVFLSIRLGRADEEEPELRSGGRERRRDQDERWRDQDNRRVSSSNRPPGRAGSARGRAGEYDGYSSRAPVMERDSEGRDGAPRRTARPAVAASRGRYDTGPSSRHAGAFLPADHPSAEFPVAGYDAADEPRDRRESRRKAAPVPAANKVRSRQRGKRDDDDDWPSTEWDKLSDEQYWAELSADKPLASMARPAKPAGAPAATAPAKGGAKAKGGAAGSGLAKGGAAGSGLVLSPPRAPRPAPERDLPGRKERVGQREPATERLPVRPAARTGQAQVPPAPLPPTRREADLAAAGPSRPEPGALLDTGPRFSRDTGPQGIRDTGPRPLRDTGPLGIRDTGPRPLRDTGPRSSRDTGPQARAGFRRRDNTGPHAARDQDLAMLAGLSSPPPPIAGALEDDPLTSPSFSLKAVPATDSRSYSNARRHAKTAGPAPATGGYPPAEYTDPGYTYQTAPPAAVPPPAPAADRYSAPPAPAAPPAGAPGPAYANPYQYTNAGNGGSSGGSPGQATAGYPSHLADPLRGYSPPAYAAQPQYPEVTGQDAYHTVPAPPAGTAPYADGYAGHPYADQPGHPDGYGSGAPVPGYEQQGYRADPYAAGGYGPYPPQG